MASNSGFDITVPSNTSSAALGDDEFRSVKSFMKEWWEQEHYATDGSATSAGVHKEGSARAWSQSGAPTAVNIGQLWHDSDDDAFYVAEASGTGSWTQINPAQTITLGGTNTWTALNTFSAGVVVSDVKVTDAVDSILSATATVDVASIAAGGSDSFDITVSGATKGSPVIVGYGTLVNQSLIFRAYVSAANTVTVVIKNTSTTTAYNPASQAYTVTVFNLPA